LKEVLVYIEEQIEALEKERDIVTELGRSRSAPFRAEK